MSTGTCTLHSWNDGAEEDEAEPKIGLRVNQTLEMDPSYYKFPQKLQPSERSPRLLRHLGEGGRRENLHQDSDDDEGYY